MRPREMSLSLSVYTCLHSISISRCLPTHGTIVHFLAIGRGFFDSEKLSGLKQESKQARHNFQLVRALPAAMTSRKHPTDLFIILEPQDQEIGEYYELPEERRATEFEAPKLWKGRPGI